MSHCEHNDPGTVCANCGPKPDGKALIMGRKAPGKLGGLAAMIMMGAALGQSAQARGLDVDLSIPQPEKDPRFDRPEKISPADYFITSGPGADEDKYYAVIMAPDKSVDEGYRTVARLKYGFDDPESAKLEGARHYPSLPVLQGDSEYTYPFYEGPEVSPVWAEGEPAPPEEVPTYVTEAQQRREKREAKANERAIKTRLGQPALKEAMRLVKAIYEYGPTGSNCHIVLDDGNLEDYWIEQTLERYIPDNIHESTPEQQALETACMKQLLTLSIADRELVCDCY